MHRWCSNASLKRTRLCKGDGGVKMAMSQICCSVCILNDKLLTLLTKTRCTDSYLLSAPKPAPATYRRLLWISS